MKLLGLDEAGRGCVLGDLFVGGFLVEAADLATVEPRLREVGARDSKALKPSARQQVLAALGALGTPLLRRISARAIDEGNLNTLEEDAIRSLLQEARPDAVWLDALGPPAGLPRVMARLLEGLNPAPKLVCEPKADVRYALVGAASIVAKVARDAELDRLRFTFGDIGSGYPSDPTTRRWLTAQMGQGGTLPDFVRRRWKTVDTLRPTGPANG